MRSEAEASSVAYAEIHGSLLDKGTTEARHASVGGTTPPMRASANGRAVSGINEWLATPAAHELEGQWVTLSAEYEVVDVADSPATLMDRAGPGRSPLIVFVQPPRVRFGV